ncbi:MAG: STAS-like domain-containing protein [Thermodesulfobacteriota bacterium]
MSINIKRICGKNRVTREDGKVIYNLIAEKWKNDKKICIDFNNIRIASVSFLDEVFGKLALKHDVKAIKNKIELVNVQPFDRALINDILLARSKQRRDNNKAA